MDDLAKLRRVLDVPLHLANEGGYTLGEMLAYLYVMLPILLTMGLTGMSFFVHHWKAVKFGREFCGTLDLVTDLVIYGSSIKYK